MDSTPELLDRLQEALGPQYRLQHELGRGGMGVIFRAVDTSLDRPVAVKVVHPELAAHGGIARRFLAEARTIARLQHPNIVAVHAAGSQGDLLWYVMDEVPGESLRQRLMREGRLPAADAARITADLASALDVAWAAGVVHRDVKPENVLLERGTGRALLVDFGIARAIAGDQGDPATGEGIAIGTPAYMSPEQAAGETVDGRSDLYALGVVLYEMLTGAPPFTGPNRVVVSKHMTERPKSLQRMRFDCPAELAKVVSRALEKAPAERFQTGNEFRRALAGESLPAPRKPGRPRWIGHWPMAAAAAALIAVTAAALALTRSDGPPKGVNPRQSILVLPFDNLRRDTDVQWLEDGSVSMLALTLSQWTDLQVVDHERLHDLLAKHRIRVGDAIGLDMARQLAREAGVWTVVLGDFHRTGDSLHLVARMYDVASGDRVDLAQADDQPGEDLRPVFDQLAARLLDLAGAPARIRTSLAQATTGSLAAFRAYLSGEEALNRWDLATAEHELRRAAQIDTTFALAYYKLALTRGWLVGVSDSVADDAMVRATTYSSRLPEHERTVVNAYRAFLGGDFITARSLYQQLIAHNASDADAWYGLGEAWYHDPDWRTRPLELTEGLRAFRRALTLDPDYALAYDHVGTILGAAARPSAPFALLAGDSLVSVRDSIGRSTLDSASRTGAMRRARTDVVALARAWVASQPTTLRAHSAMVDALIAAGDFPGALAEAGRYRALMPADPEYPFVEARIRFASGDVDRAAETLRGAVDTTEAADFRQFEGNPTVFEDLAAAANVFAYQGDLVYAAKAIDLADRARREVYGGLVSPGSVMAGDAWHRSALGQLYAAVGAPAASLRRVWQSAAEAGRMAAPAERTRVVQTGGTAAVELFAGLEADSTALTELGALTGEAPPKEVRALLALSRRDPLAARRALAEPDTAIGMKAGYMVYRRPLAAEAYYRLGDYQTALSLLDNFEPDIYASRGFDSRWGLLGRVRLMRAELFAKLGHTSEARAGFRQVLNQWKSADPALNAFVRQAERGLANLGEG
jgi:eukaryotic-like serine/threonine-protein kinase